MAAEESSGKVAFSSAGPSELVNLSFQSLSQPVCGTAAAMAFILPLLHELSYSLNQQNTCKL